MFRSRCIFISLVLVLEIFNSEYVFSQNYWNILVTTEKFYSVKFAGSNNGWAVGNSGVIIKTTDGGGNWRFSSIGNYMIRACYFLNSSTGFLCCYNNGRIYKSTDSGISWILKYSYSTLPIHFNDIFFADSLSGWAIGEGGKILHTTNRGNNWIEQTSNVNVDLYSIYMLNSSTGFITGGSGYNRRLLKTIDGGTNWLISVADSGQLMQKIFFVDNFTGWILNNPGSVSRTTNGGQNWIEYVHNIYGNFNSIYFINAVIGWMAGSLGIYKTSNGGMNWSPRLYTSNWDSAYYFCDIYFTNSLTGTAVGAKNQVYKTTNGGDNWFRTLSSIGSTINSVYFISDYTGWAVTNLGEIIMSTNGGLNWVSQFNSSNFSFKCVYFINLSTGWVTGNNGNLFRTLNNGSVWENIFCGQPRDIYSICFRNQIGWIVGAQGFIGRSINSGTNWVTLSAGVNRKLYSVYFLDINTGWAVGDSTFLMTTNSGNSWQSSIDSNYTYRCICFVNSITGFVAAHKYINAPPIFDIYLRKIIKTTNGGFSWNEVNRNYGDALTSMTFFDTANGYFVSRGGEIFKTINGGITWINDRIDFPFVKNYNSVFARSDQFVWAVGDTGTVVSKYNGIPIGISTVPTSVPWNYLLSQNYPNPFNPITKIKYSVPKKANIVLKVFDVLGRVVLTLINVVKYPGNYETEFDGTNLASGLYFYRLEAGDYTETKKMVLIK